MNTWIFSHPEWWVVTQAAGIYRYPAPVAAPCVGDTDAASHALHRRQVLLGPYLPEDLDDTVRALAGAQRWIDIVWKNQHDHLARLVGAVGGSIGVVAIQNVERTGLLRTDPGSMVAAALDQLPAVAAGREPAVRIPRRSAQHAELADSVLVHTGAGYSPQERAHHTATAVLDAEHTITGQIAANIRTTDGARRRSGILRWFDNTDDGRYLAKVQGQDLSIQPAGPDDLHGVVTDLLTNLT